VWASAAAWTALIKDHFSKRADASFTEADFKNTLRNKYKDSFNSGDETNAIGIYRDRYKPSKTKINEWYYIFYGRREDQAKTLC
jgi:hypothetical protein